MDKTRPPTPLEECVLLRQEISKLKTEGKKIISHFKKLEEYYDDWQDRFNAVEKKLQEIENEVGIPPEQIAEYNAFDEIETLISE